MSNVREWVHANRRRLAFVMLCVVGVSVLGTVMSGPQMRKVEYSSEERYRALAWTPSGLQVQIARHDPTTELNAWLSSLDVRSKSDGVGVNAAGIRFWNYETNGLSVWILQVPLWCIMLLAIAAFLRGCHNPWHSGHHTSTSMPA